MRAGLARVEKALRYSEIGNVDKLQVRQKMSRLLVGTVQLVLVIRVIVISLKPYSNFNRRVQICGSNIGILFHSAK